MSKAASAYNMIKQMILSGRLQPLEELSEKDFQEALNVSRTPVREAFQQLEHEGLVEIHPRKSIVVAPISFHLLEEIYDTRLTLEPKFFASACGQIPDDTLIGFRSRFRNAPKDLSPSEYAAYYNSLDAEFHSLVLPYANNRFLADALASVLNHELRIRNIMFNADTNELCVDEHVAIINALLQRSKEDTAELVRYHVDNAKKKSFLHFFDRVI